jgi:uncharacterized YigZ family protein
MKLFTIQSPFSHELLVKKSRFLALLQPAQNEDSVKELLAQIKQEHRNATHHPHAYRIGDEHIQERYVDDGEPPKSSGLPILQELENAHLTNVLLTVTRYFGGIKLGLGGLSRAYRESAAQVILSAQKIRAVPLRRFQVCGKQECAGKLRNLLERHRAHITEESYGEQVTYTVEIERSRYASCREAINSLTKGKATIQSIPNSEKKER